MTNTELIERYPFLVLRNDWTDEIIENYDPECDGTYLDDMPKGWKIAFGERLCEELREALIKDNYLNDYRISQVKEKYGSLHWYDNGASEEVCKIIDKYEEISYHTCCICGAPATKISNGWICPYCDECFDKYHKNESFNIIKN